MDNEMLDFIEKQEIMDNLGYTLKKLHGDDEFFSSKENLEILTVKTYEVMKYMEKVNEGLSEDPGVQFTSKNLDVPIEKVVADISDIMLMSTVARQALLLEKFQPNKTK